MNDIELIMQYLYGVLDTYSKEEWESFYKYSPESWRTD